MEFVRWQSQPVLQRPTVIAAFTGWNDAADAASEALKAMITAWSATPVATIDPDEFTDFAVARPQVRLADGHTREIVWPQTGIWAASTPGSDLLLVLGPEPSLRWRTFSEQIVAFAQHYNAAMVLTLGALLADVVHTRPVRLIGTATDQDLIDRFDLERSQYEGPTGIVGVLHDACSRADIPSASLWAATPGYAGQVTGTKAAVALVRRATSIVGTQTPFTHLDAAAVTYTEEVERLIADDDDLVAYVRRIERMTDDEDGGTDHPAADAITPDEADGEQLIEELEQFLRNQGPES